MRNDSSHRLVSLPDIVGGGYRDFWSFTGRYRVCKGGRASKKSKTTALNLIVRLMLFPLANLLVVRKVYRTLRDSCFAELKWATLRLGVDHLWDFRESSLEISYKPTGQKIFFRGLDNPIKITSIAPAVGRLCWMWIEEAFEISSQDDFDMLDESIRGHTPEGLFKQITLTLNPWNENHWIKRRFFDADPSPDILAKTSTYLCNEFLDDSDKRLFHSMKINNPKRYLVAGLGHWGVTDGLVFENWQESSFDISSLKSNPALKAIFGLDFGYTNDPSALFCALVDTSSNFIFVFDEIYQKALTNRMLFDLIRSRGYSKETIWADSAEPKSIDELRYMGLSSIRAAKKPPGSILSSIQFLQNFKILVHPSCLNFLIEISNYSWASDRFGNKINRPLDGFNHLMDAMRYASQALISNSSIALPDSLPLKNSYWF